MSNSKPFQEVLKRILQCYNIKGKNKTNASYLDSIAFEILSGSLVFNMPIELVVDNIWMGKKS